MVAFSTHLLVSITLCFENFGLKHICKMTLLFIIKKQNVVKLVEFLSNIILIHNLPQRIDSAPWYACISLFSYHNVEV